MSDIDRYPHATCGYSGKNYRTICHPLKACGYLIPKEVQATLHVCPMRTPKYMRFDMKNHPTWKYVERDCAKCSHVETGDGGIADCLQDDCLHYGEFMDSDWRI